MTVVIGTLSRIGRVGARLRGRSDVAGAQPVGVIPPASRILILLVLLVAVVAAGVVFLFLENRRLETVASARTAAVSAARSHAEALFSYDYRSIEDDAAEGRAATIGEFRKQYVATFEEVLFQQARQQETVVTAQVRAASVISARADQVVVLLFVNQATEKKTLEATKVDGPRVVMTLDKVGDKWLVSDVKSY